MTAANQAAPAPGPAAGGPDPAAPQQPTPEGSAGNRPKNNKLTPQAGILNRPPEHLLLAAIMLTGSDPRSTVQKLRDIVHAELTSDLDFDPAADPNQPPPETGELGFDDHYDRAHLTITVGFSSSGYDRLVVAQADRPADLVPIPWDKLGDPAPSVVSGDLVLQICADNAYITEHVLRRIEHSLASEVQVAWVHTGAQRYNSRPGRTARREGRAWIGFLDGTSNLRPGKRDEDHALTFVDPDAVSGYPKSQQPP